MVKVSYFMFIKNDPGTVQDFGLCLEPSCVELPSQMGQLLLCPSQGILSALTILFLLFGRIDPMDGIAGFARLVTAYEAGKSLVLLVTAGNRYAPDPFFRDFACQKSGFERFSFLPSLWNDSNDSSPVINNVCELFIGAYFAVRHIQEIDLSGDPRQTIPCFNVSRIIGPIAGIGFIMNRNGAIG